MIKFMTIAGLVFNVAATTSALTWGITQMPYVSAVDKVSRLGQEELHCMQQNVFFEARDQSILGQQAVVHVTINRVKDDRWPDTICDVVWQNRQFSWTHDGRPDYPSDNIIEQKAWDQAYQVVVDTLISINLGEFDPTEGATHYHNNTVDPYWASRYDETIVIDSHIFYRS